MIKKYSLLIGNGINLVPYAKSDKKTALAWKDLIVSVFNMSKYSEYKTDFVDLEATSYPLKFERLMNYLRDKVRSHMPGSNVDVEAKEEIIKELSKNGHKINPDIAKCIRSIPCSSILTTNYDTNIESCVRKKMYRYPNTIRGQFSGENPISFKKTARLKVQDRPKKWHQYADIYHIHGIDCVPNSICLGYLHYSDIVARLKTRLIGKEKNIALPRIVQHLQNGAFKKLEKEYETRFFDSNMDIIGLGLSDQEIDLWWILSLRAKIYFGLSNGESIIQNTITYYDIHTERTTPEGYLYEEEYQRVQKELFSNMHIEYVPLVAKNKDGYKAKYINAFTEIARKNKSEVLFYETEANNYCCK